MPFTCLLKTMSTPEQLAEMAEAAAYLEQHRVTEAMSLRGPTK